MKETSEPSLALYGTYRAESEGNRSIQKMKEKRYLVVLALGLVLTAGGVYGLYLSGDFWTVAYATNWDEDALAIGLPGIVILLGTFINSYVLLASPMGTHWSPRLRLSIYIAYASVVIAACWVASRIAGRIAAGVLQTT